jgi:hypothetical protein
LDISIGGFGYIGQEFRKEGWAKEMIFVVLSCSAKNPTQDLMYARSAFFPWATLLAMRQFQESSERTHNFE